jgi:hypothetical protein
MNALARDTGGRPIFNTNALEPGLKKALNESSTYYLLAWKPEPGSQRSNRFRKIEVSLIGKPDLSVRVRKGFFDVDPEAVADQKKKPKPEQPKTTDTELRDAVVGVHPARGIPIALSVAYVNAAEKGELLSTSVQIPGEFVTYGADSDKSKAIVDLAGVVYDSSGKVITKLTERVTVTSNTPPGNETDAEHNLTFNFPTYVPPGLYQVRVGARDLVSGKVGTAHGWIEIPNAASGQLVLSSVLLGERENKGVEPASIRGQETQNDPIVNLNVSRRFNRDSYLRMLVFVYNAMQSETTKSDAAIQVQVVRDGQPVVTTAQRRIDPAGTTDPKRLPYAAEVPLSGLPPGRYLINVTVFDRIAKKSATQQARFEVL